MPDVPVWHWRIVVFLLHDSVSVRKNRSDDYAMRTYTSSIISTYLVTWQTRYTRLPVSNTAYTIHFPLLWTMSTVTHSEFWKIYFSGDMRQWTPLLVSNTARIIRFALGECAHTVRESKRRTRGMKSWRSARSSALISRRLRPVKFHWQR